MPSWEDTQQYVYDTAIDSGLTDEQAQVAVAIAYSEAGYGGAVGDTDLPGGGSYGVYQFYRTYGQLPAYAAYLGVSQDEAAQMLRNDPLSSTSWALNGYLGNAIRRGSELGYSGYDLAEYAQRYGQVSQPVQDENGNWHYRSGRNWQRLFGNGNPLTYSGGGNSQPTTTDSSPVVPDDSGDGGFWYGSSDQTDDPGFTAANGPTEDAGFYGPQPTDTSNDLPSPLARDNPSFFPSMFTLPTDTMQGDYQPTYYPSTAIETYPFLPVQGSGGYSPMFMGGGNGTVITPPIPMPGIELPPLPGQTRPQPGREPLPGAPSAGTQTAPGTSNAVAVPTGTPLLTLPGGGKVTFDAKLWIKILLSLIAAALIAIGVYKLTGGNVGPMAEYRSAYRTAWALRRGKYLKDK